MLSGASFEASGGNLNITVDGPTTIANNLFADTQDVNIIQNSLTGGQTTTISGNVFAEEDIFIENNGGQSTNLNITGTLTVGTALGSSDIVVLSGGNLLMAGASAVGVTPTDHLHRCRWQQGDVDGCANGGQRLGVPRRQCNHQAVAGRCN